MGTLSSHAENWLKENGFSQDNWNKQDAYGNHSLSAAILKEEYDIAKEILSVGKTDLNLRNDDGNQALWFACFKNQLDLIELLVEAGIDINNQNLTGVTCLMYAASTQKTEVVKKLLKMGADSKIANQDDSTALDFASNIEILKLLK